MACEDESAEFISPREFHPCFHDAAGQLRRAAFCGLVRRPAAGSWTPSLSLPRQTMAGDGREEMPWENLFADHMQDDFATVSGSGSSPEEEVFSNL